MADIYVNVIPLSNYFFFYYICVKLQWCLVSDHLILVSLPLICLNSHFAPCWWSLNLCGWSQAFFPPRPKFSPRMKNKGENTRLFYRNKISKRVWIKRMIHNFRFACYSNMRHLKTMPSVFLGKAAFRPNTHTTHKKGQSTTGDVNCKSAPDITWNLLGQSSENKWACNCLWIVKVRSKMCCLSYELKVVLSTNILYVFFSLLRAWSFLLLPARMFLLAMLVLLPKHFLGTATSNLTSHILS